MHDNVTYGAAFADVYDEWYGDIDDLDDVVGLLAEPSPRRVLELGVGTGRIAIPLAARLRASGSQMSVTGLDESPEMLARLAENDTHGLIHAVRGDMADDQPSGPFDLVFISYNTLFNLIGHDRQRRCVTNSSARLATSGLLIIDACVIDTASPQPTHGATSEQRGPWHLRTETSFDSASGRVTGTITSQHEDGRVTLRPFTITYSTPENIDDMCTQAGLVLVARYGSWQRTTFDDDSPRHVSVYRNLR
jgi:SAM-dependent methyltransferase